ncbi:MAG: hypothetical protein O3B01_31610 [Planctomycetota bacterium]|nr:hypothetical protein [Planctomycetota bacterium]
MPSFKTALASTLLVSLSINAEPDYPEATIASGEVSLTVKLPDPDKGFYRGPRFDWSSCISVVKYKDHTFFGNWQGDKQHDPFNHDDIMGIGGEFGMGTTGLPGGLGYELVKEGGPFTKIGVGVLLREAQQYMFFRPYKFQTSGKWSLEKSQSQLTFAHSLDGPNGYAYHLQRVITVDPEQPVFRVSCTLENKGEQPILQSYYAHNFIIIDSQPMGPDYEMTVPYELTAKRDLQGFAKTEGKTLSFLKPVAAGVFTEIQGFNSKPEHNTCKVLNKKTGASITIQGDQTFRAFNLYFTPNTVCPEFFIKIDLKPGEKMTWTDSYTLSVQ